jgi:hypothetical protein
MNEDDFERVEFWTPKLPYLPEDDPKEIESPFLCIGFDDKKETEPHIAFYAFPDEGHNGSAEWIFRQPLRAVLEYWLDMHKHIYTGELVVDDPEARLLSKLIRALDDWKAAEDEKRGKER